MKVALTIAGSDSGGGAGIQADLKTFAACGVYGTSVITAITAQNTEGVSGVLDLPKGIIAQQLDAVCSDFPVGAAKTGMLSNVEIIETVSQKLRQWKVANLVVDPVMVAKSGDQLLHPEAIAALCEQILPLARVVTPNLPEAEAITRTRIVDARDRDRAARDIWDMVWDLREDKDRKFWVLIKGGHRVDTGLAEDEAEAEDILFDGAFYRRFSAPRIASNNTHGTGCTFSAAIAAGLAKGLAVPEAVSAAKDYITCAIEQAPNLGHGHGPLQHFPA